MELFETQLRIDWVIPRSIRHSVEKGNEVVVWIDPIKLDASWKKDTNFYIGHNGSGNAIGKRYENFGEWLKQGKPVEMPEVGFGYNDTVSFGNGRHRFAWMRDHGATAIPVLTDSNRSEEFKKMFGASEKATVLKEGPERDLFNNSRAVEIIDGFKKWLSSKGQSKIEDIMYRSKLHNGMAYSIPVRNFMQGAYKNLLIGFACEENPTHAGFQTVAYEHENKVFIVLQVYDFDISKGTPSQIRVNEPIMIHEIIHYFDRMRHRNKDGTLKNIKGSSLDKPGYHSDPLEFNAYYQQGVREVIREIENRKVRSSNLGLDSFQEFSDLYLARFNYWGFVARLNPEFKKKFDRRFYKLYEFLVEKYK